MSSNPNDLRQWIQEIITRSATDQLYNLQRFEELVRRTTRGDLDAAGLRAEYLEFAREETSRYINDLTRLGLSFYNTLIELNRKYNDEFFERITTAGRHRNGDSGDEHDELRIVEMTLHGALGGVASRAFVIENRKPDPVQVSFLVSEFSEEGTQTGFRPPIQLKPARFTMNPGEERPVSISIPLLPEFFAAGRDYSAMLIASGFPNLQLRLLVQVDQALDTGNGADTAAEKRRAQSLIFQPVEENSPAEGESSAEFGGEDE